MEYGRCWRMKVKNAHHRMNFFLKTLERNVQKIQYFPYRKLQQRPAKLVLL